MTQTTKERKITYGAKETIELLRADGFDNEQIKDAMCDGQVLKDLNIDQETAEEIYEILS